MKALHNSALSKLESWEVRIDCVTALTERVVTLTKGTMWRHRHESASAGAPPSRGRCTCAALCFLHRRTFYWETALSSLLRRSTIGKLDSHAPQPATRNEMHPIEQWRGPLYTALTQWERLDVLSVSAVYWQGINNTWREYCCDLILTVL